MVVEPFTYEDIYELLRAEKFATDLEEIPKNDLARIKAYLKSKEELLKKQEDATSILSSQKKIRIQQEIDNAIRALKDLYELREKKIINRSIYGTRTGSQFKDTTNMLANESSLYEQLLTVLHNQKETFFKMIDKATPTKAPEATQKDAGEEHPENKVEDPRSKVIFVEVSCIQDCPEMFGEDLEKYGPFKPGEDCKLPEQLCTILETQGKVKRKAL
jgi:DNA replication initiation complex subunit (GINS family)